MFPAERRLRDTPIDRAWVGLRTKWQAVVETTQIAGRGRPGGRPGDVPPVPDTVDPTAGTYGNERGAGAGEPVRSPPVLTLRRPADERIRAHLALQGRGPFSYACTGLTRDARGGHVPDLPAGYVVDHNRVRLGHGAETFERARDAVRTWQMFEVGWAELLWRDAPIEMGTTVGILMHAGVAWSLNAARIVYVLDERGGATNGPSRFGFGYGTLADHAESGEERFLVERDPVEDAVWYDLTAFSRPAGTLTRLAGRYARGVQQRFARHSLRAMVSATASG
jgi:uncharacterized protein (UPF0548 family)